MLPMENMIISDTKCINFLYNITQAAITYLLHNIRAILFMHFSYFEVQPNRIRQKFYN